MPDPSPNYAALLGRACLPGYHADKMESWADYLTPTPAQAQARALASQIVTGQRGEAFLTLLGARGVGKTQLSVLMAKTACRQGRTARYTTAGDMFRALVAPYQRGDGAGRAESDILDEFTRPHLLVVDDLHEKRRTEREDGLLADLIDARYRATRKITVLIANLSEQQTRINLGPSAERRIDERGEWVTCAWPPIDKEFVLR